MHENLPKNQPVATLILAHGAGAPMDSTFMEEMTRRLVDRGIAVLRFEFAYMAARRSEGVRRPPDAQMRLLDCWRQAYRLAGEAHSGLLAIGGKSMGGRMASMLADELEAAALVCLGYPFHAAGKPQKPRVAHLATLQTPTLIVQGERDRLGNRQTVASYRLSDAVRVHWLEAADHDFRPLQRSGYSLAGHLDSAADVIADFLRNAVNARKAQG